MNGIPPAKRAVDLFVVVPAIVVLAPVILIVALLSALLIGRPVIFRQERPGWKGKPFLLYKFRTMVDARTAKGELLPDSERLTPFGRFLRRSSFDELPELINVLKGDMSLVGPRPLLMKYLDRYNEEQARRHDVKPGITGWAQVNGRNSISWDEKFRLDLWYIDHWSLSLDFRILGMTLCQVLRRKDINQPGQATMEEFPGSK